MPEDEEAARRARMRFWLWRAGIGCAILYALLVLIWYYTGAGEFWPLWAMYAMGGLLLFLTYGAFAKNQPTSRKKD
ncbi:MAG: hypothetical protein Q7L55_03815 [Actinomycetota bacterium]|nr:hypothetical protein [Actinomycetota bacterium]